MIQGSGLLMIILDTWIMIQLVVSCIQVEACAILCRVDAVRGVVVMFSGFTFRKFRWFVWNLCSSPCRVSFEDLNRSLCSRIVILRSSRCPEFIQIFPVVGYHLFNCDIKARWPFTYWMCSQSREPCSDMLTGKLIVFCSVFMMQQSHIHIYITVRTVRAT